ncbi:MAG: porin [Candidatus Puniceispirillaceae bacterium]
MKKILFATTALFALGGVTAAVADVSISGHVRFHYGSWKDDKVDTATPNHVVNAKTGAIENKPADVTGNNNNAMSTDPEIWIKGNMVTENGLTVAPEIRIKGGDAKSTRHYIRLSDDWGTVTLGHQHSPARLMSVDGEWRGTVSGASSPVGADTGSDMMTNAAVGSYADGKVARIICQTPNISGFQFGVSAGDAGSGSKANPTDFALVYNMDAFEIGALTFGYAASNTAAENDSGNKNTDNQFGIALDTGTVGASFVRTSKKAKPKMGEESKQTGTELELNYSAGDNLKLVLHMFNAKGDSGKLQGQKYKSTGVGVKYTITPGLWTSVGYNTFNTTKSGAKQKGNAMRIRIHAGF